MATIKKLLDLLSPSERKHAGLLMGMILVMAFLDMLGVASILPFIAVLANPSLVDTNPILSWAYRFSSNLGVNSAEQFLFLLGFLVFFILVFSLAFKALTTYAQTRFALMREYSICRRLVEGYLYQPYEWFLNRNSADLGKNILSEVSSVIHGAMIPFMTLLSQTMVAIALLALLLMVNPLLALSVGLILGVTYGAILLLMTDFLSYLGESRVKANQNRFEIVGEAFGAVKEVKVAGLEQMYIELFSKSAEVYAKGQATSQVVNQLPRFLIEAIAFGGMLLVILYLMSQGSGFATVIPVIALYALAGYRLMPALQQIYGALTQLSFSGPALDALYNDIISLKSSKVLEGTSKPMPLNSSIELKNIFYNYPNAPHPTLKGINLAIPKHSRIGFVGLTGSGKTTTVDLILGLLEQQEGVLSVDGQAINASNRRNWQRSMGYVPQHIYLSDNSVAANIAFGVNEMDINMLAVESAAKIANLHDFVVKSLPEGYATQVGERGVRLSGGQRQRIGIARALYHSPQILILDEATSALDNVTEEAVMDAVNNLGHQITIILVAHRLSTVRDCDQIYLFEDGAIKAQGTYQQLLGNSQQFKLMAGHE